MLSVLLAKPVGYVVLPRCHTPIWCWYTLLPLELSLKGGMLCSEAMKLPLLDLPQELIERIVTCLGSKEQKAKKAVRASCRRLRYAINASVTSVQVSFRV